MSELTGKVAVVTGASKGIGAAIAKALGAAGASVVVNYASSKEGAERVVAEIISKGGKAIAVHGNVAEAKDVQRLFAETKKAYGALDVLVNNAGSLSSRRSRLSRRASFTANSTSTSSAQSWRRKKLLIISALAAAASSTSAP